MIRRGLTGLLLAALAAVAGCPPMGPPTPAGVSHVDKVMLMASPAPINWDALPGADGFQARVLLFQQPPQPPQSALLAGGTIEFFLFRARVAKEDAVRRKPYRKWTFPAEGLTEHRTRVRTGWGYSFRLPWGSDPPKCATVTLIARVVPPDDGQPVYSEPIVIPMKPG